jgi:hypothetical protein
LRATARKTEAEGGDLLRRNAEIRAQREQRQAPKVLLRVFVPKDLKAEFKRLAGEDGIPMQAFGRICVKGYVDRDPGVLALIEQWKREQSRPILSQKRAKEMFSAAELKEIWREIGDEGDDDGTEDGPCDGSEDVR